MSKIGNNSEIGEKVTLLRKQAHDLGLLRQYPTQESSDEAKILKQIDVTTTEISQLIASEPTLAREPYFAKLPEQYRSMVSAVRNSWEVDSLLRRDEIVFKANIQDPALIRDLLAMEAHAFSEFLKKAMNNGPC